MMKGTGAPGFQSMGFDRAFRTVSRYVRYGKDRDKGEMHSMRWMVEQQLLRSSLSKPLQLYVNLLRACKTGQWPHEAATFYSDFSSANNTVDDVLTHAYIAVLQHAKEYGLIADLGERLLAEDAAPSATVIAMIAQAASEIPRPPLVMRCYDLILDHADSQSATQYAAFACLTGIGKCGVPDFLDRLDHCAAAGIIEDNPEAKAYLILQYANYAADPVAAAAGVLHELRNVAIPLTERIFNQLFQLHLRIDSDEFLGDMAAADALGFRRRQWIELLLTWADRRRYALTSAERREVLRIVGNYGIRDTSDDMPSCRPMLAMLQHDDSVDGCGTLRIEGRVVDPPRLMDPRVHFLRSRRHAIRAPDPSVLLDANSRAVGESSHVLLDGFLQRSLTQLQRESSLRPEPLLDVRELP
jgi:hypothetical protein